MLHPDSARPQLVPNSNHCHLLCGMGAIWIATGAAFGRDPSQGPLARASDGGGTLHTQATAVPSLSLGGVSESLCEYLESRWLCQKSIMRAKTAPVGSPKVIAHYWHPGILFTVVSMACPPDKQTEDRNGSC